MTAQTPAWHVDDELLRLWVDGRASSVSSTSVEQHLVRCATCRGRVSATLVTEVPATVPDLEQVWAGIRDDIELPRQSRARRALQALGVSESDAMLFASAPAMRVAWLNSVALVLAFVAGAALFGNTRGVFVFLLVAPLVPMLGVALAYSADAETALEQEAATPYSPVRLVLLRSVAVLVTSLPLVVVGGLLFPAAVAAAWLVPALGFTAVLLAASTWYDPVQSAVALATGWVLAVTFASVNGVTNAVYEPLALVLYAVAGTGALVVLVVRLRRNGSLGGLL
jgi:hypothetical protein